MPLFENKYGYFSDEGNEYIITSPRTPKPWINVISNGEYGLVISQTGGGFSWLTHSELNRLNRWHQDLVQDNWGKYIYIKDNTTGDIWSPSWQPVKNDLDSFKCIHGIGYTIFETIYRKIKIELIVFVPFEESIEIWDLKIDNLRDQSVDLSLFTYFEWCLGSSADHHREFHRCFIDVQFDRECNGLLASKRIWEIPSEDKGNWNTEYPYTGFLSNNEKISAYDSDKSSFLGQYGSLQKPISLMDGKLSQSTGTWGDPVACLKNDINVKNKSSFRIVYTAGLKKKRADIVSSIQKFKNLKNVDAAFLAVKEKWKKLLGNLEIETPDKAMNLMVNTWLPYQAISGRLWGRTAYYQQSGAYGFRDQLQDSLIFLTINPEETKKQIRLHARHQFFDGTVLHWWHPITELGLATKMTDDLLWLPFLVIEYIKETANFEFLNELEPYYDSNNEKGTIFEHCIKAIDKALSRFSERGLPLIGAGDWNDGINAAGLEMKGESIWLTEFIYLILTKFSKIAKKLNQDYYSEKYEVAGDKLQISFNKIAWDGEWYFRGTKDNGEKFGSAKNSEGQIYLNPQVWAVISNIAPKEKQIKALNSVEKILLKNNGCLLLYPAYHYPDKFIGYLTRYAPGRRENGGVYTHASTWAIIALCKLDRDEIAYDVFKKICPIYNSQNPDIYEVEPYVTPGNIDGPDSKFYGRGGWTWYTGSAAWYQKVIVEWILGIRACEEGLLIDPHIPLKWVAYKIRRLFRGTTYLIQFNIPEDSEGIVDLIKVDGEEIQGNIITPLNKPICNVEVIIR